MENVSLPAASLAVSIQMTGSKTLHDLLKKEDNRYAIVLFFNYFAVIEHTLKRKNIKFVERILEFVT